MRIVHQKLGKLLFAFCVLINAYSNTLIAQAPDPVSNQASQDENDNPATDPDLLSAIVDANLIDAFVDQTADARSLNALRTMQRAFRLQRESESSSLCLQEILRLTHSLRMNKDFERYAELGSGQQLTDAKIALRAAVRLTDLRKYNLAADYYDQWLRLNARLDESYLYVLVLIEKGRLHYLANEFQQAERAFRQVLSSLNSDWIQPSQEQQLLRNSETTYRMMANTFLKTGDHELARKMFDLAGVESNNPIRFFNEAQIALATGDVEKADEWVHRFIAKQPNHSDAYRLLRDLYGRKHPNDAVRADLAFISDLELIRKKFRTGKVLDDFLISYFLKQNETGKAKKILEVQRSDTLWRDRANRLLLEIAFRDKDLDQLIQSATIEADEHEDLTAIRKTLDKHGQQMDAWSELLLDRSTRTNELPEKVAITSLLLSRKQVSRPIPGGSELIRLINENQQLSRRTKTGRLMLLGREAVIGKCYRFALQCFASCLALNRKDQSNQEIKSNQGINEQWIEERPAFEGLMSLAYVHCQLGNKAEAMNYLGQAESILRTSPALMHLQGWAKIQFGDFGGALVEFDRFLDRFDKTGASGTLARLIERARLETAYALFLLGKKELAIEMINDVLDRNPLGPDLDAFERNNQKYTEKLKLFLKLVDGVKDGGPFPLGRN